MKILLLSRYSNLGASSRYRCYQYLPYLEKNDCHVVSVPLLSNKYIHAIYSGKHIPLWDVLSKIVERIKWLSRRGDFDFVWVQQECFPWFPYWLEVLLYRLQLPYVVDYDDAFFHRYDLNRSSFVRSLLGTKIDRVMQAASVVIAGNEYIARRASNADARKIEVLPTVVDLSNYQEKVKPPHDKFRIGWIGSPSTVHYLSEIHEALIEVCKDGDSEVVVIGGGVFSLSGVPMVIKSWSQNTETEDIRGFDVGIMPLRDTPWERGKCGFKLIQYFASGLPAVGSPVGVNDEIITNGIDGFKARTTQEWISALSFLKQNERLRNEMGKKGRKKVEQKYSLQISAPKLLQLFKEVVTCSKRC